MSKAFHYTVVGRWPFPLDMLRHDQSVAESEADQALIDKLSGEYMPDDLEGNQVINLVMPDPGSFRPNAARWQSFSWGGVPADLMSAEVQRAKKKHDRLSEVFDEMVARMTQREREALDYFRPERVI